MKLFIEDKKGYVETYQNVYAVKIKKIDNKNFLEICFNSLKDSELIPLKNIELCYLINEETMHEYFRYER